MAEFGLMLAMTEHTVQPVELAQFAEREGFESIFFGEHTHLPIGDHRFTERNLSDQYKQFYDPFIALAAIASVTERLKLGTAVSLITEHHPITLANLIGTLEQVSNGRVMLGVGTGWNEVELANHGVEFKHRWKILRERILAMKEIWNNDEPEYHGEFVDFDPIWCWPKPVQAGGPPILVSGGKDPNIIARRVASFGDGWIPLDGPHDLQVTMDAIQAKVEEAGRAPLDPMNFVVGLGYAAEPTAKRIEEVIEMGFGRVIFTLSGDDRGDAMARAEKMARLIEEFQ